MTRESTLAAKLRNEYLEFVNKHGQSMHFDEQVSNRVFEELLEAGYFGDQLQREKTSIAFQEQRIQRRRELVKRLQEEVEQDIRIRGGELESEVFVGEFPIGSCNACAMPSTSGNLILLNAGLFQTVYAIGKVFVNSLDYLIVGGEECGDPSLPMAQNLGWPKIVWTREDTIAALTELFVHYSLHSGVGRGPRLPVPDVQRAEFLSDVVHQAEKFVVAHEYAHILQGHCENAVEKRTTPFGELNVFVQSQRDEFDADILALNLLLASKNWSTPEDGGLGDANRCPGGIALLFAANLLMDHVYEGAHDLQSDQLSDHPRPNDRAMKLAEFVCGRYGDGILKIMPTVMVWAFDVSPPVAYHVRRTIGNPPNGVPEMWREFSALEQQPPFGEDQRSPKSIWSVRAKSSS